MFTQSNLYTTNKTFNFDIDRTQANKVFTELIWKPKKLKINIKTVNKKN